MKNLIRVPLDPYAFIEFEHEGTPDSALIEYKRVLEASKAPTSDSIGIPTKDWQKWLDQYLTLGTGDANVYHQMSKVQMDCIQEIKKSMARLKAKDTKNGDIEID